LSIDAIGKSARYNVFSEPYFSRGMRTSGEQQPAYHRESPSLVILTADQPAHDIIPENSGAFQHLTGEFLGKEKLHNAEKSNNFNNLSDVMRL
jgi:hypothetical protein